MEGFVLWFTGLSGSGKSTLTARVSAELRRRGVHVEALDGDEVRRMLSKGLGFSKEDRDANIRRIGYVARMIARSGACGIAAAISPYKDVRDEVRRASGRFVEVYCECPIEVLAERDPKGLYKKALAGEIRHFTGVDDPYEPPQSPEVRCRTDRETPEQSAGKILARLEELGYVTRASGSAPAAEVGGGTTLPRPHGGELVDLMVEGTSREAALARVGSLPAIDLDERAEHDVANLASGAFSPLRGFLGSKDHRRVVDAGRLESGLPWPVPITLAVDEKRARDLEVGGEVALRCRRGRRVAILEVSDVFAPEETPGGTRLVGGELRVIEQTLAGDEGTAWSDPRTARQLLAQTGWRRTAALHTAWAMARGDEHAARCALEFCDGLLLTTVSGPGDGSSVAPAVRRRAAERVVERYFPPARVRIVPFAHAFRDAGEREAILHAIVAKNHGATHFAFAAGSGIGGSLGAGAIRRAFDRYAPGELGIVPLVCERPFFAASLAAMATEATAPEGSRDGSALTGAEIERMVARGERPAPELARPEVVEVLLEAGAGG